MWVGIAVVFMGSEKYPGENEYDEFVSEHGGSTNAWTDAEATVFHFDVLPEAFPKALDIFAHCLAQPRLSPVRCCASKRFTSSSLIVMMCVGTAGCMRPRVASDRE